jgi:quaternary ammonium compound-resistance protein SugE
MKDAILVWSWIFLIVSSLLQLGWLVSLRQTNGMTRLAPLALNAVFGFTSTVLLSQSLRGISMSTAYAVWTGLSVAGSVLVDICVFQEAPGTRVLWIGLIVAGASGLKIFAPAGSPVLSR